MNFARWKSANRTLLAAGIAGIVWLAGIGCMELPFGSGLRQFAYDGLHLVTSHPPFERVAIVVMNETTDRKLERVSNQPFNRRFHADLLKRLTRAGVERVCYDIQLDLPGPDAQADVDFREAIKAHGHVILGAAEQVIRRDATTMQIGTVMPIPPLREVAEGWGVLNVAPPDADGVVRRVAPESDSRPTLAGAAARAAQAARGGELKLSAGDAWYHYQALPGSLPTFEFADCLDAAKVPDTLLRGYTVFVGGNYSSVTDGRPDSFRTPYSRFGGPDIPGVEWHATAFANLRDGVWFDSPSSVSNALVGLLLPVIWFWTCILRNRKWEMFVLPALAAVAIMMVLVFMAWGGRVLIPWAVVGVQSVFCLVGSHLIGIRPTRARGTVQILLSAVSNEFGSYRPAFKIGVERPWSSGKTQSEFLRSGHYTLEMLDQYIEPCDAVVHICGDMTGASPKPHDILALKRKYPDLGWNIPELTAALESKTPPSYTQFEAYVAIHLGKFFILACPAPDAERDPAFERHEAQQQAQQVHLQRLRNSGKYPAIQFKNPDDLVAQLLRSDLYEKILALRER
jgi:CHASE2 domain-containing sensor protein